MPKKTRAKNPPAPKLPEIVFVKREFDPNDKSSSYLTACESVGGMVDSAQWTDFAIYKRVGKGKGRTTDEVKIDAPKQIKTKFENRV